MIVWGNYNAGSEPITVRTVKEAWRIERTVNKKLGPEPDLEYLKKEGWRRGRVKKTFFEDIARSKRDWEKFCDEDNYCGGY